VNAEYKLGGGYLTIIASTITKNKPLERVLKSFWDD